jgi:4-phospho-D-threonate 3-dehydrogenase / 4-phospho-D-erythronate 3-dehydrogenase
MAAADTRPIIAVTIGEPAGVGPEIVLLAVTDPAIRSAARCFVVGEKCALAAAASSLRRTVRFEDADEPASASYPPDGITIRDTATLRGPLPWGRITAEGGAAAFATIKEASRLGTEGEVDAVATAPIHKECLRAAKVPYIDHTAMLTGLTGSKDVMTMFATGNLKVIFLTRHLALRDVPAALSVDVVYHGIISAAHHLRSLGIARPKLAVAALNPHGGEHGLFGTEEDEIITPGMRKAAPEAGAELVGPVPADAVFHKGAEGAYDAVLSLYHDQGHIATKTLDFHGTVSFTLGLPFLRTSVDHGTAFDIAGKGTANPHGMKAALLAAVKYAASYRAAATR